MPNLSRMTKAFPGFKELEKLLNALLAPPALLSVQWNQSSPQVVVRIASVNQWFVYDLVRLQ